MHNSNFYSSICHFEYVYNLFIGPPSQVAYTFPFPSWKKGTVTHTYTSYYSEFQLSEDLYIDIDITRMASCDIIDKFVHCTHLRKIYPDWDPV